MPSQVPKPVYIQNVYSTEKVVYSKLELNRVWVNGGGNRWNVEISSMENSKFSETYNFL